MGFTTSQRVFVILSAIFVCSLIVADLIGAKLFVVGGPGQIVIPLGFTTLKLDPILFSAGIIPFPVTFLLTDLVNEFYGPKGARFITYLGLAMAIYVNLVMFTVNKIPAIPTSPMSQSMFSQFFGLSSQIFVASLIAYLVGQLLDIQVFFWLREITQEKMLWLRSTGSTVISQLVDSFIVIIIAFSGKIPFSQILHLGLNNYIGKFLVAIALTPLCYAGHALLHKILEHHRDVEHHNELGSGSPEPLMAITPQEETTF